MRQAQCFFDACFDSSITRNKYETQRRRGGGRKEGKGRKRCQRRFKFTQFNKIRQQDSGRYTNLMDGVRHTIPPGSSENLAACRCLLTCFGMGDLYVCK